MKIGNQVENRPIHLWGVIGLFFFILFAEMTLGSLFYSQGLKFLTENPAKTSWIIHIGLLLTKGLILWSVFRLVMVPTKAKDELEETPSIRQGWPLSHWFKWLGLICLLVFLYRLAFDSYFAMFLMGLFGMSGDLDWSMYLLLGVPVLGYGYIFLTAPIFEEIIYRGIFYDGMRKKGYSVVTAAVFSAVLFGVMHLNVVQGVNAFVLGLLTAFVYEQTQKLFIPILFHIINNIYVTFCSEAYMSAHMLVLTYRLFITAVAVGALIFLLKYIQKKQLGKLPSESV